VQYRATVAVNITCVGAIEHAYIFDIKRRTCLNMRQPLPAAANAEHLTTGFGCLVNDALDNGIQTGDVAAAGQYANAPASLHRTFLDGDGLDYRNRKVVPSI
jgi:hypothetical protein